MMGIMMPETCWDRKFDNKHRISCILLVLSLHHMFTKHSHKNLKLTKNLFILYFLSSICRKWSQHINSISMPCLDTFNGAHDYSITVQIGSITTKPCIKKNYILQKNRNIHSKYKSVSRASAFDKHFLGFYLQVLSLLGSSVLILTGYIYI